MPFFHSCGCLWNFSLNPVSLIVRCTWLLCTYVNGCRKSTRFSWVPAMYFWSPDTIVFLYLSWFLFIYGCSAVTISLSNPNYMQNDVRNLLKNHWPLLERVVFGIRFGSTVSWGCICTACADEIYAFDDVFWNFCINQLLWRQKGVQSFY